MYDHQAPVPLPPSMLALTSLSLSVCLHYYPAHVASYLSPYHGISPGSKLTKYGLMGGEIPAGTNTTRKILYYVLVLCAQASCPLSSVCLDSRAVRGDLQDGRTRATTYTVKPKTGTGEVSQRGIGSR